MVTLESIFRFNYNYKSEVYGFGAPLAEMANFLATELGIQSNGKIFLSTKYPQHGCRIKFCPNPNQMKMGFAVSIPDMHIVFDNVGGRVDNTIRKAVIRFAIKNQHEILNFWDNGMQWTTRQVTDWTNRIQPLTATA